MKIDWAPLNVPLERRLQTLSVGIYVWSMMCGPFFWPMVTLLLLIKGSIYIQLLVVAYLTFIYIDLDTADKGGRGNGIRFFRRLWHYKYMGKYFPIDLVKTVDLPADRNYLFAVFPHGLLSFGAGYNFVAGYSQFEALFPGIRRKLLTLKVVFYAPIYRELLFSWGSAAVSAKTISTLLSASNDPKDSVNSDGFTSNGTFVVIGGAQEAFYATPKNYTLVLKNRKGFVKLAMQSGVPVVPVVSFNEVDVYDQVYAEAGSKMRKIQDWTKRVTGVAPIVACGRGFFQYSFGLLPQRKPITTVVGGPVEMPHIPSPSKEEITEAHDRFCLALVELFETHKSKYIEGHENVKMTII